MGIKTLILAIGTALLLSSVAFAGPENAQKKGYIQNDNGDKCWYTQIIKNGSTYFHGSIKDNNGILTFDDPACMSDSGTGLGLDINKGMINNIISKWYSLPDAKFQTRASEMYSGSAMQKKGQCIQSKTYPTQGITVDYIIKNNSIAKVIHGSSIQGCTN